MTKKISPKKRLPRKCAIVIRQLSADQAEILETYKKESTIKTDSGALVTILEKYRRQEDKIKDLELEVERLSNIVNLAEIMIDAASDYETAKKNALKALANH